MFGDERKPDEVDTLLAYIVTGGPDGHTKTEITSDYFKRKRKRAEAEARGQQGGG
jgi:hypothetical protein